MPGQKSYVGRATHCLWYYLWSDSVGLRHTCRPPPAHGGLRVLGKRHLAPSAPPPVGRDPGDWLRRLGPPDDRRGRVVIPQNKKWWGVMAANFRFQPAGPEIFFASNRSEILGILCMSLVTARASGGSGWFCFVAVTAFITTLMWSIVFLLSIREALKLPINWVLSSLDCAAVVADATRALSSTVTAVVRASTHLRHVEDNNSIHERTHFIGTYTLSLQRSGKCIMRSMSRRNNKSTSLQNVESPLQECKQSYRSRCHDYNLSFVRFQELVSTSIETVLYFIAFLVQFASASYAYHVGANIAAGVFGLFITIAYAASSYLLYQEHKAGSTGPNAA
ncbi:hypothetical protein EVAR_5518_1 [Eumeta japonica]|uniref:MARVEL domain-containing protein n=1 Tax=Eumeta variegata TaxID=151549 RepID=A0A4C1TBY6_EUMVA|nr:hypothetical protein EVAR_5518_1 [Eumeta japonica]